MGYYTTYDLKIDRKPITEELEEVLTDNAHPSGYGPLMRFMDGWGHDCKWYEHDSDMKKLSKQFPEHLFILHGEGEENGDMWIKYFLDGKMQVCKAVVVYPDFDEAELK